MSRVLRAAALPIVLLLALLLRLWGIDHGLPNVYEHDEIGAVLIALRHASGELAPPNFYHGTLLSYLLAGLFGLCYAIGRVMGVFAGQADFVMKIVTDGSWLYLAGRLLVACAGTLTVWAVYEAGRRLADRTTGWIAALFTAVSVLHVNMSKLIKEDMLAAVLLAAGFLAVCGGLRRLREGRALGAAPYAWTGWWIGLAVAAKYYSAPAVVWLVLLAGAERPGWRAALGRVAAGVAASAGAFFLANPFALPGFLELVEHATGYQGAYDVATIPNPSGASSVALYLGRFLPLSVGVPVLAAALLGCLGLASPTWRLRTAFVLAFPLAFLALLIPHTVFPSFLTPAVPFVALLAAMGIRRLAGTRGRSAVAVSVAVVCAVPGLLASWRFDRYAQAQDTRALAKAWIERHLPAGSRIAVEGAVFETITFGPPLQSTPGALKAEWDAIRQRGGDGRTWAARWQASLSDDSPRFAVCKTMELTEEVLASCRPEYAVVITDAHDVSWGIVPHDRAEWVREFSRGATLLTQFDAAPGVKFFPTHWSLREEPENLAKIGLFDDPVRLATGPRVRIYQLRGASQSGAVALLP